MENVGWKHKTGETGGWREEDEEEGGGAGGARGRWKRAALMNLQ